MPTPLQPTTYTLEDAETDIAALRGQVDLLTEILTQYDSTVAMNAPAASGYQQYSSSGQMMYAGFDGTAYNTGISTYIYSGAGQTINLTSFTPITGLSQAVAAGVYSFSGVFRLKQGTTGLIAGNVGFTSPALSFCVWFPWWSLDSSGTFSNSGVRGDFTSFNVLSQAPANAEVDVWYQGNATFSAPGTLQAGCIAASGHSFTVQAGTFLSVSPVT